MEEQDVKHNVAPPTAVQLDVLFDQLASNAHPVALLSSVERYDCVGLTSAPKTEYWYCPDCRT